MSCSTAYLVRDLDGVWRVRWEKYGVWRIVDARARDELLAEMREHGAPLAAYGDGWLCGWLCRGVLLDMIERRFRFYVCGLGLQGPKSAAIENIEREVVRAEIWAGWDVAYAWGGRDEFAELVPEASAQIESEPFEQPSLEQISAALLAWDEGLIDWDRQSLRLRFRYAGWSDFGGLLSVIDERLDVLDYGFVRGPQDLVVLPWLLHGARLLDSLASAVPHALPYEHEIDDGVIIDLHARCIRYWSGTAIPPALLAAVRAAWPSWSVERLRFGLAGHLAATGRSNRAELLPEVELLSEDFTPDWLRERAALSPDARGLRCIKEVLVDD